MLQSKVDFLLLKIKINHNNPCVCFGFYLISKL